MAKLEALGGILRGQSNTDIETDRRERAVSELMSGEFDVQG
jgi:hypothetical protein